MNNFLSTLPEIVADRLKDHVNDEMKQGRQYDPFSPDNLREALMEATDQQYAQLSAVVRAADPVAVNAAIHLIAREYWFDYACRVDVHVIEEQIAQEEADGPDLSFKMEKWELPGILQEQAGMR